MVMEVLSRMLNRPPPSYQFHRHCEKVSLTHLTFANDLMIFCAADDSTLSFINETIRKFGDLSGLFTNLSKISMFVVGVNSDDVYRLTTSLGFVLRHLPVRYLGLPLLSGRLRPTDCALLFNVLLVRFILGLLEFYHLQVDCNWFDMCLIIFRFTRLTCLCCL